MHIKPECAISHSLRRRGSAVEKRQRRIRALSTPGQVAGAATNNVELTAHQSKRPTHPRLPLTSPLSGEHQCSPQGRTKFHPPTTPSPTSTTGHCTSCSPVAASATSPPSHTAHAQMAKSSASTRPWPANGHTDSPTRHIDTETPLCHTGSTTTTGKRPHSALGDRRPISRVHNLCGHDN